MFNILWYLIVGFVAGWIAKVLLGVHLGFWATALLGIIGSIVGGFIARLWSKPAEGSAFHPAGFLMSIVGAAILLLIGKFLGL